MNHLAHALLAGADDDLLLGSLLGDFCRGAPDPAWSAGVRAGVILHRRIDVYTDSHPVIAGARTLFEPPLRRYAGILLDVYFDHVLAREWARYHATPLGAFSARCVDLLDCNRHWLPADLNRFAAWFRAHGLFAAYAEQSTIEQVLGGISRRLRHANRLGEAGPMLWALAGELEVTFDRFLPELDRYAREQREALGFGAR